MDFLRGKSSLFVLAFFLSVLAGIEAWSQSPTTVSLTKKRVLSQIGAPSGYAGPGDTVAFPPGSGIGQNPSVNPIAPLPLPGNSCTNSNPKVYANQLGGFQILPSPGCFLPPHANCRTETDCDSTYPLPGVASLPSLFPVPLKSWSFTVQDAQNLVNLFAGQVGSVDLVIPANVLAQDVFFYESWLLTKLNLVIPNNPPIPAPAVPVSVCVKKQCGDKEIVRDKPVDGVASTTICACEYVDSVVVTVNVAALQTTLWWIQLFGTVSPNAWLFYVDVLGCHDC